MALFSKKEKAPAQPSEKDLARDAAREEKARAKEAAAQAAAEAKAARKAMPLAEREEAKAREKATKKGVDIEGALWVGHDLQPKGNHTATLVVFPDRVELHNHGETASILRQGKGVEVVPMSQVTSMSSSKAFPFTILTITGAGVSLSYRGGESVHNARQVIDKARAALAGGADVEETHRMGGLLVRRDERVEGAAGVAPANSEDPIAKLKELAGLMAAGVITEAEFEAKKTELLSRI